MVPAHLQRGVSVNQTRMEFVDEPWVRSVSTTGRTHTREMTSKRGRSCMDHVANGRAGDLPGEGFALPAIQHVVVETLDGQAISIAGLLNGRCLLLLADDRSIGRRRTVAEHAWVEERLDPGVRLVLVWTQRPPTIGRISSARSGTMSVIDTSGVLREYLAAAGRLRALLADSAAGYVETVDEDSEVFSLGREIRVTDARGNDHVIDLGDLT